MEKEFYRGSGQIDGLDFLESEPQGLDNPVDKRRPDQVAPAQPKDQAARKIEHRFQMLTEQMNEMSRLLALKTERMSIKIKLLEERHQTFMEEIQRKLTQLNVKMSDKPRVEIKIAEVIERHNQVVRTFENRLGQIKRVVENQEAELFKAMNELQEARRARLRARPPSDT